MDRELSDAALRDRFLRIAQRSQAALDQGSSTAPEEAFPPKLDSFTDAKCHALRDEQGNRHLYTKEEMRDGNYPCFQQRSKKLFQSSLAIHDKLVIKDHDDEWETGLAMTANPENALERTDLLFRIQARALETWRYGQDGPNQAPRDDEPVIAARETFDPGNNPSGRWKATAELVKRPSDALSPRRASVDYESRFTPLNSQTNSNHADGKFIQSGRDMPIKKPAPKIVIDLCSPEPESDGDPTPASPIQTKVGDSCKITKRKPIHEFYRLSNTSKDEERESKRLRR